MSDRRFIAAVVDRSAGAKIRTATYAKREHLVIPIIAMVGDAVIRPLNSTGPELVPSSELMVATSQWNGRAVVADHPHSGVDSANQPATLDSMKYGEVFDSRFEDGKLKMNAYLDPVRAEEVGCGWVIEDFKAGRMVELSVGAWVTLDEVSGVNAAGQEYQYRWRGIISDHVAIGLNGQRGACSIDTGCGAMREAAHHSTKESSMPSLPARVVEAIRSALSGPVDSKDPAAAKSDVELRDQLAKALRASEPGFDWILDVDSKRGGGSVIYMAMPEDRMLYLRRSFTLTDNEVSLGDDREEVEQKVQWKPKAATADVDLSKLTDEQLADHYIALAEKLKGTRSAGPGCRCHESATPTAAAGETKETDMAVTDKAKALATKLIACSAAPYQESDRATLEAWPEAALENLDKAYEGAATHRAAAATATPGDPPPAPQVPETPKTPDTPTNPAPKALTEAEWLASAPPSVRTLVSRAQAQDAQAKAFYVEQITKLQAAGAYSAEKLNSMSVEELEPLARALNVQRKVDFSPIGAPVSVAAGAADTKYPDPPSPWDSPTKGKADATVQ